MIERRSVPENKHYVAVKAADLDLLEAKIARLRAELAAAMELLLRVKISGYDPGPVLVCDIDAELAKEKERMSTLLERWDRTDHKETINRDDIRRALAIAQAVEELKPEKAPTPSVEAVLWQIRDRADELLEGKK